MEEMRSKLNSTQKIVVNLLQQLVTECTDRVPVTPPCTVVSTTGYIVYRPGTALYSCFNNWLQSVPTRYRLHSLCTAYLTPHLFISRLFTGLRLMTGLIMCSPWQEVFPTQKLLQPVTEFTNRLPTIQFSLSSFASHQLVTRTTDLSCAITVLPLFNTGYRGPGPTSSPSWGSPS